MTKYILHGGFTQKENELNRTFYEEVVRDVPNGGVVLLCYFASRENGISNKFKEDSDNLQDQAHRKNLTFLLANEKDFMEQLEKTNALYIRGGSTPKLLGVLKKYDKFRESLDSKTVAGSSAGAYAIGRYSAFHDDESGGEVREGLGLLPLRVVCHYESLNLPPNPRAFSSLQNMSKDLELVILKDFEWRVFTK